MMKLKTFLNGFKIDNFEKLKEYRNGQSVTQNCGSSYIITFLQFLYYLCIIPFRPAKTKNGSIILEKRRVQQIICAFVSCLALLDQGKETMKGLSINILSEPLKVVPLVMSLVDGMYVFSWLYSFWGKQKQLQKFLSILQELPEPEPKLKVILLCKRCFYPFLLFITVFAALFVHGKFSWAPKQMFFLDYYNSTTIMHGPLELEEQMGGKEFFLKILEELAFYLDIFVFQCVDILVILMTKSAYLTVGWYIYGAFLDDINTNADKKDLGIYVEIGKRIQVYFEAFNDFGSPFFLSWYCMIVPWISYRALETFRHESYPWMFLYNWIYIVIYGGIIILCSEIRRRIENFRSAVNETVFQEDHDLVAGGRGVMKKVKHYMQECGVHGGRFFIFSYGFMGSTVGLVVAYAFLLLQLHISASATSGIS